VRLEAWLTAPAIRDLTDADEGKTPARQKRQAKVARFESHAQPRACPVSRLLITAMLLLAGCAGAGQADENAENAADLRVSHAEMDTPACIGASPRVLTGSGVGAVRIRTEVSDLPLGCPILKDTTLWMEGQAQPAILIGVDSDTVTAEIVDGKIWRLRVLSPGLHTHDSIAVGAPAAALAHLPDARIVAGEGSSFVIAEDSHCGLSFALAGLPFRASGWSARDLASMEGTVTVSEILITGACHTSTGFRIL
jgi:hypothetical protein